MSWTTDSIRKTAFALCASAGMAAFAGSDDDPIIAGYVGQAFYDVAAFVDGIPGVFQEVIFADEIGLDFKTGNEVTLNGYTTAATDTGGTWKKQGAKYLADFSTALTAQLDTTDQDGNSKVNAKFKKIVLVPGVGMDGKVRIKRTYKIDMLTFHQNDKGVFGCVVK